MSCFAARWILIAAAFSLTACGKQSSVHTADSEDEAVKSTAQPLAKGVAAHRLSARIALDSQATEPAIDFDGQFRVILTNNSNQPIQIWNPDTKPGYHQFSFGFKEPSTGKERIARKREVEDDDYWKALAQDRTRDSDLMEIAPKGELPLDFAFSEFAWGNRAWTGLPSPNSDEPYSVSVHFANSDSSQPNVWTGSIQSTPIKARFVASSLKTPHEYLWVGFAEKAIEMMEAEPEWVAVQDEEDQCTPLHHAARFGPPEAVKWLLDHGADVNAKAYNSFTPLHFAQDPEIVRLILMKRPDLTLRDTSNETVLQSAASNLADARNDADRDRWRQIVKLYVGAGGGADILTAATIGDLDRIKAILAESPEFVDGFQDESPLRVAASHGHLELCRYLLANYRIDVNDFERGVGYPIIKEALAYPAIVRLLIEHGADLKTRITWRGGRTGIWIIGDDATALHFAAEDGVPETIALVIDNGVDFFATAHDSFDENDKQTALEVAAFFGKADNAKAIVNHPKFDLPKPEERQAILNKCLLIGAQPSWLARDAKRPELMEVLIKKGANPNAKDDGVTPVQRAARGIHPTSDDENAEIKRIIKVLTAHGATVDLFAAVAIGDEPQVQALLDKDPKLANSRAPDGYPALHFAVSMDYRNIVAALLKAGGDVNIRNESDQTGSDGGTALDCAEFWNRDEIAKLLIQAGGKRRQD